MCLQDSHLILKPAEILGLWANPIFVAPSWSHPKNRSRIRTRTQDEAGFLGPIRYNPIRFSLTWMAAETGVFRDARLSVVRSLEAAFR